MFHTRHHTTSFIRCVTQIFLLITLICMCVTYRTPSLSPHRPSAPIPVLSLPNLIRMQEGSLGWCPALSCTVISCSVSLYPSQSCYIVFSFYLALTCPSVYCSYLHCCVLLLSCWLFPCRVVVLFLCSLSCPALFHLTLRCSALFSPAEGKGRRRKTGGVVGH